jgi:hypothetical protein
MKTYTVKIDENGDKYWYFKRKLHREDGPAIEYANGDKFWIINDELHREDGPAVENVDGYKAWYIDGIELTAEQFNSRTKKNLTPVVKVVEIDGIKYELKKIE